MPGGHTRRVRRYARWAYAPRLSSIVRRAGRTTLCGVAGRPDALAGETEDSPRGGLTGWRFCSMIAAACRGFCGTERFAPASKATVMKHIFIINPKAGRENAYGHITAEMEKCDPAIDYAIYLTKAPGDATDYIHRYCSDFRESVRFYACGGDGTLHEVVNGVAHYPFAAAGCFPCGSGNDFVKYYGGSSFFESIPALVHGTEAPIDLLRVGDRYAINAVHFGFDSCVAQTMTNLRRKKIIGGRNAYMSSVIYALVKGMRHDCTVEVDGEVLNPAGQILLCTVANGQYVGGSYRCAPRSRDDDGFLEVCLVLPISRFRFFRIMGHYKKGEHLDDERFRDVILYRRAKRVHVEASDGFVYSMDGELFSDTVFDVEIVSHAMRFVIPEGAKPIVE